MQSFRNSSPDSQFSGLQDFRFSGLQVFPVSCFQDCGVSSTAQESHVPCLAEASPCSPNLERGGQFCPLDPMFPENGIAS